MPPPSDSELGRPGVRSAQHRRSRTNLFRCSRLEQAAGFVLPQGPNPTGGPSRASKGAPLAQAQTARLLLGRLCWTWEVNECR